MKVLVLSSFFYSDPERVSFYTLDRSRLYERMGVKPPRCGKIGHLRSYAATAWAVRHRAAVTKPDLIVLENPRVGMLVSLFLKLTGVKIPTIIWNLNILQPYYGIKRWFARAALRSANAVVVYSRHERSFYAKHFDLPLERVRFKLFSGAYLEDKRFSHLLQDAKQDYVVSPGYSGRDFHTLAEVAARAPDIHFLVLAYPSAVGGIKFPPNVELRHGLPEVEFCRCIARARVCFLPIANRQTANGQIAIVQAMSLRTLLFTNLTPGTKDYLVDGENCLLYSGEDMDDHARRLTRLYESFETFHEVVWRAYAFARVNFSVKTEIRLIERFLEDQTRSGDGLLPNAETCLDARTNADL